MDAAKYRLRFVIGASAIKIRYRNIFHKNLITNYSAFIMPWRHFGQ